MGKFTTAEEAREITKANLKGIDQVYESIGAMARSGNNYSTIKTKEIYQPETVKSILEANGFTVVLDNYLNITW